MKKLLIFTTSYLLGIMTIFMSNDVFYPVIAICFYGIFMLSLKKDDYKTFVTEPFVLSITSVFIIAILSDIPVKVYLIYYLFIPFFVLLYKAKGVLFKEEENALEGFVQSYLFPVVIPVGICTIYMMFSKQSYISEIIFVIIFFFATGLFVQNIQKPSYAVFLMVTKISVLLYLMQFLTYFSWQEKTIITTTIVIVLIHQVKKNGGRFLFFTHLKPFWKKSIKTQKQ